MVVNVVRNERGIALGVAILALVLIGALVASSLFLGVQEQRVGHNTVGLEQAFAAAQEGAQLQVANWSNGHAYNSLAVGDSATFAGTLGDGTGHYHGAVQRLSDIMYLVRTEGFDANDRARQHIGLLVRLRLFELGIKAGFETRGKTEVGGSSRTSGQDQNPAGWAGCPTPTDTLAGIRITDADSIQIQGVQTQIVGDPPIEEDPTITDSTLTTFGDMDWAGLTGQATLGVPPVSGGGAYQIQPSLSGGVCNTADWANWGEPEGAVPECAGYFPVINVPGNLKITSGRGQGILIVDGNLEIQGNFRFYGPVIVRGLFKMAGTGINAPKITGGVVAANVAGGTNQVTGAAEIQYSSCTLLRALSNNAPGALIQERSWVQLY